MRFLYKGKDGGLDSPVTGYWLIEIKGLFSIVLLKFEDGYRENYHSHAFNALTWFIKGSLIEDILNSDFTGSYQKPYKKSVIPKLTKKDCIHRVFSKGVSWCFSIRGPWAKTWHEYNAVEDKLITLTNGRKVV